MSNQSFPGIRQVDLDHAGTIADAIPLDLQSVYRGQIRFYVTAIRFNDDGGLEDEGRLDAAIRWIRWLRESDRSNGVITVLFVHGWQHDADWDEKGVDSGDLHYAAFRNKVLRFLALREAERNGDSRFVFGIYVGWDGHPGVPRHRLPGSFFDRFRTATNIAAKGTSQLQPSLAAVFRATKLPTQQVALPSPLILMGHSMGGLILESALSELVRDEDESLFSFHDNALHTPAPTRMRDARGEQCAISFPDVVLTMNSAGSALGMKRLQCALYEKGVVKSVAEDSRWRYRYRPPVLVSYQTEADFSNRCLWPLAKFVEKRRPGGRTVGFDRELATHEFRLVKRSVECAPKESEDFGQNHHCLRAPTGLALHERATPPFFIDLPDEERQSKEHHPDHSRWELRPLVDQAEARLAWIFRVPKELVDGHGDVFNSRACSLSLAMTQISGAVVSLARNWDESFEGEEGPPLGPLPQLPNDRSDVLERMCQSLESEGTGSLTD